MHKKIYEMITKIPETVFIGCIAGFISGLLGLGGGVIFVPAMVYLLQVPQHVAQGTALLVIIPTALSGAIRYYLADNLNLEFTIWLAAGAMFGVLIGSLIAHKLPPPILRKAFGVFIIVVALKMFVG